MVSLQSFLFSILSKSVVMLALCILMHNGKPVCTVNSGKMNSSGWQAMLHVMTVPLSESSLLSVDDFQINRALVPNQESI